MTITCNCDITGSPFLEKHGVIKEVVENLAESSNVEERLISFTKFLLSTS